MKTKLLILCVALCAVNLATAQVYVFDAFDYSPLDSSLLDGSNTNSTTSTTWADRQGGTDDMLISEASWSLSAAFDLNPQGNAVAFQGGGEDGALKFASPISGAGKSVYLSFLVDIKGWDVTGQSHKPSAYRFVHLGVARSDSETNFNAGTSFYIGPGTNADEFKIGLSNADVTPTWFGTDYKFTDLGDENATVHNNQFFIVIKTTLGGDGTSPDNWMWVNPTINSTEPAADVSHTGVSKVRTEFVAVNLEASSNDRTPSAIVDELRVTGTWEEALGLAPTASVKDNVLNAALSVYPNPSTGLLNISTNTVSVKQVQLLDLTGKTIYTSSTNNAIDTSRMAKGLYLLKVSAADGATASRKVIIQ